MITFENCKFLGSSTMQYGIQCGMRNEDSTLKMSEDGKSLEGFMICSNCELRSKLIVHINQ